ncbi:PREDICTED: cell wall adhesin EAP1-like [Nelumbo nucifera]|uniref:Cell wall adhesin EAP1-like n=1 Tax=Nelumbo nucifera TaxID=4432 RepID=A0A1U7ZSY9_NELNU|nr:PREDICTED: cell wall adhesin EAP1-like [Nelumbo nucifera]
MNRIPRESLAGGRNSLAGPQLRKGRSNVGFSRETDENLDLFSRNRRSLPVGSSDERDGSVKLGRISVEPVKLARSGMDDLLSSVDGGKHDYDWLLTPPGTPLFSSSDTSEFPPTLSAPRSSSSGRSVSTTKASRLSVMQSENNHSSRPTRSSSVTQPSVHYNTNSSNNSNRTSMLNTSSASVTSLYRPSTPTTRSNLSSSTRPCTLSSRSMPSRSSTPSKSRPGPISSPNDKTKVPQNLTHSTLSTRPQVPANLNFPSSRPNSQSSTPNRLTQTAVPVPTPSVAHSASVGRLANGQNPAPASRGSSQGPRARPPSQPIVIPDFPHDTPSNLRTTLPDRPVSAGRSRPGVAVTVRGNLEAPGLIPRRQSSPSRGRISELSVKGRLHANVGAPELQKVSPVLEPTVRKPVKPTAVIESTGFGRTISKKSLDMALRHMDIRNGTGSIRSLAGTTLFPQSIRSSNPNGQPARPLDAPVSISSDSAPSVSGNGAILENGNCTDRSTGREAKEDDGRPSAKLSEQPDMFESSRYDAILLKEDMKNTNWLHSVDDKFDQSLIFYHRFDPLPEPFGLP